MYVQLQKKKVFVCRGGYCTIRRCLRERGWVEKDHKETESPYLAKRAVGRRAKSGGEGVAGGRGISRDFSHTHHCDSDSSDNGEVVEREKCAGVEGADDDMGEQKYHMLCRAVRNADPNFVWTLRRDDSLYHNLLPSAFANHFAKASSFTTKVGLCANLRNLVWCGETHSDLFFPRCFLLSSLEEKDSFINDYRFTTALNILKLVTDQQWGRFQSPHNTFSPTPSPATTTTPHTAQNTPQQTGSVTEGSSVKIGLHSPPCEPPVVPEEAVGLALRACSAYVSSRLHEDIEEESKCLELTGTEWQSLINYYYKIVLEGGKFACSTQTVRKASDMLDELEKYLPQLYMDGVRNIWIVKPGAMSRGRGIVCLERLEPILELVSSPFHKEGKWVVQKYIERPLLIYGTKFDIRQWFLITDWAPLTMWMYKDCYLRFATQRFTLDNMNESVHLCNNSIQRYYTNSGSRSELLPEENMWHSSTFKDYLEYLGQDGVWDEVIYPGMKHALTCAMMVSQDIVEGRKNSFELYGADFMLTDDFKPWLIEINCSPTMEPSTSVTSQLCAQVMEDTIRVVVDRRENKEASTGKFELAYRQPKFDTPSYIGIQLCVEGVAIHRSHTHHRSAPAIPVANISYTKT
jgi:tubulin monoglycylase TTLL3/8